MASGIIYAAAEVLHPVAYYYIRYAKRQVVAPRLVEDTLCDGHVGGFVLHDDQRTSLAVIDHGVTSFLVSGHQERYFVAQTPLRIAFLGHQKVRKMLSDPLFRGQRDVSLAQRVKDQGAVSFGLRLEGCLGEIEFFFLHARVLRVFSSVCLTGCGTRLFVPLTYGLKYFRSENSK